MCYRVTTEGHSNGSVPYSVQRTGFGKEVALVMENHGDVYEHPCSAEVEKCAENAQTGELSGFLVMGTGK